MKPNWLDVAAEWTITVLYAVLLGVGILQVGARYVVGSSFSWTEELDIYLFIWLIFIGAGHGVIKGVHPRVSILEERLPLWAQRWARMVVDSLIAIALVLIMIFGIRMVMLTSRNISPGIGAPVGYAMYLALPVGAALMLLNVLRLWGKKRPGHETASTEPQR